MEMNSLEKRIYNSFKEGETQITIKGWADKLHVSGFTICKYINRLVEKGLLSKHIIITPGGTTKDSRRLTAITKKGKSK